MHDRGVQPAATQPRTGDATNTAAETRGAPVTNEGEFDAAQEAPAGIDQQGLPPPNPGWVGWWYGGGGGGGGHRFGPMMFGPGIGAMVGGGGPWNACGPGRGRRGGGRGRGGCDGNARRYWSEMQLFGDDADVRSVSGHMEDCHIVEERQGSDDDESTTSSSSSASSNSSSSSSSDSGSDDDDRSSKRGGKSKRKHGKRRKHKQRRFEEIAAVALGEEAQATSSDKHEGAADGEVAGQGPRSSSKSRDRDKGQHKHCHGNHKRHRRHHGHHHQQQHHFDALMCPPPPPLMPGYGPPPPPGFVNGPPPPGFFDGPPPPGYFAGPPQCLPDHPSGTGAEPEHVGADLQRAVNLNGCSRRHSRKFKKTAKKFRKANRKAWKMRMKMERQLERFAADDADLAAACEVGDYGMMPPPWVFFARHFRRHHHRCHGGRRRFCNGEAGTGREQLENPEGNRAASRDGAAAEGVHPSGTPHDAPADAAAAGGQTPMEDVEIGEEALADRGGSIERSEAVRD